MFYFAVIGMRKACEISQIRKLILGPGDGSTAKKNSFHF